MSVPEGQTVHTARFKLYHKKANCCGWLLIDIVAINLQFREKLK